jgi:putative ABC transport system substrate-binding protein
MRRRQFLGLVGGAAVVGPRGAWGQQSGRVRRVGVPIGSAETAETRARVDALRQALNKLGWTDDKNIRIDVRHGGSDPKRIEAITSELLETKPDVVVSGTSIAIAQILRRAPTVPVVFASITDPIGQGFVASLSRPGGNATGFAAYEASLGGKWIEILKEVAPSLTRAAILYEPISAPYMRAIARTIVDAGPSFKIDLIDTPVHNVDELEGAIANLGKDPNSGLILPPSGFTLSHSELVVALAAKHRLPAIYPLRFFVLEGGLISYGADSVDQFARAATYVDRIFRGEKPADLPVQNPIKYELIINLKAARVLGLTIPPKLLFTADEVIE